MERTLEIELKSWHQPQELSGQKSLLPQTVDFASPMAHSSSLLTVP